jgi:hypothetical protein
MKKTEKELLREIFGEDVSFCEGCEYCSEDTEDGENEEK